MKTLTERIDMFLTEGNVTHVVMGHGSKGNQLKVQGEMGLLASGHKAKYKGKTVAIVQVDKDSVVIDLDGKFTGKGLFKRKPKNTKTVKPTDLQSV